MPETVEHRLLRSRKVWAAQQKDSQASTSPPEVTKAAMSKSPRNPKQQQQPSVNEDGGDAVEDAAARGKVPVLPEFPHVPRPARIEQCVPTDMPAFLYYTSPKVCTESEQTGLRISFQHLTVCS